MNFDIYRFVVPLIALAYIFRIINQYQGKTRGIKSTVFWTTFWVGVTALALIPNQVSFKLAEIFGFRSNVTAIIFVALGLLFIFIFYLSNTIEKMEKHINTLTREMAYYQKEQKKLQKRLSDQAQHLKDKKDKVVFEIEDDKP